MWNERRGSRDIFLHGCMAGSSILSTGQRDARNAMNNDRIIWFIRFPLSGICVFPTIHRIQVRFVPQIPQNQGTKSGIDSLLPKRMVSLECTLRRVPLPLLVDYEVEWYEITYHFTSLFTNECYLRERE